MFVERPTKAWRWSHHVMPLPIRAKPIVGREPTRLQALAVLDADVAVSRVHG
jgi:hypothetical protein